MKVYKIDIKINASKEAVWNEITNFKNYPKWNSILEMKENDSLIVGEKFSVTINKPNGKKSKFKATTLSKEDYQSFSAQQKIIGDWFFSAVHHFTVREIDPTQVLFIQKWELKGIISSLFRKQIFEELESFNQMNIELKDKLEQKQYR
ncbi:SRPBCC domain-containing protein [Fulvivirgaceae bacterium BMA12]|uniref:SRPBCC domain-containing protein n=1 Tax=Agaribacillus aureus TaxID=3051825 RepID=A0ABT8LGK8_9BACT|nr:SRPBCC domain-containing protein [Fulvivirgaceae bacterium BMA12]